MADFRAPQRASDVPAQLRGDLGLIAAAVRVGSMVAESVGDPVSRALCGETLADEKAHAHWPGTELWLAERPGLVAYLLTQIGVGEGQRVSAPITTPTWRRRPTHGHRDQAGSRRGRPSLAVAPG